VTLPGQGFADFPRMAESRSGGSTEIAVSAPTEIPAPAHAAHFYRSIFEHSVWGIFQTSKEGFYLTVNPALARIYGYDSVEELLEAMTDIAVQLYVDPARRGDFIRLVQQHGVISGFESQVRRRDGSVIWISESCREVCGIDGDFLYFEGVVENVTARKQAEKELRAAKEEAEIANRSKTEFLANISHELRTPLNAIIGFGDILAREFFGPLGDARYAGYARDIHDSGSHLLSLINDILDIAKIELHQVTLAEDNIEIGNIVDPCVRLVSERAKSGGIDLLVALAPNLPALRADERRLKQIVLNLLSNAVKFTPPGGRIEIGASAGPEGFRLWVADTGIGMTEDDIAVALTAFGQVDSSLSRHHEGTGLGLPLALAMTQLHGGTLAIESTPSRGTVVTVMLPPERMIAPKTFAP